MKYRKCLYYHLKVWGYDTPLHSSKSKSCQHSISFYIKKSYSCLDRIPDSIKLEPVHDWALSSCQIFLSSFWC